MFCLAVRVCERKEENYTRDPTTSPTLNPTGSTTEKPTENPTLGPTSEPTKKPTQTPTKEPTKEPTKLPTPGPTSEPTKKPTQTPTKEPTNEPTKTPTQNPTNKPTEKPTPKPTKEPTKKPTSKPTKLPTKLPTNKPTPDDSPSYECVWPSEKYSAITKGDFISGAKMVYHKLAVGGTLKNPANSHVAIDGKVYYGNSVQGLMNFNEGKQKIDDLADIPVDYGHFEWLAKNLKTSNIGGKRVFVKTTGKDGSRGGCYSTDDFVPGGQGEDNGNTLVVFNTSDDICLTKTGDGRQFGPSVLAPFSNVILTNSGFLDGTVIAKTFTTVSGGDKGTEQQLHGDTYTGKLECIEAPTKEPTKTPTNEPEQDDGVCACDAGSQADSSWKCGKNIYICPGVEKICDKQVEKKFSYYKLTQDQCNEMKRLSIGDTCIALPQYGVKQKPLNTRVCYNNKTVGVHGMMQNEKKCLFCKDSVQPTLQSSNRLLNALGSILS